MPLKLRPTFTLFVAICVFLSGRSFADSPMGNAHPQRLLLIGQGPDGSHKPTTHEYFAGVNLLARLLRDQIGRAHV